VRVNLLLKIIITFTVSVTLTVRVNVIVKCNVIVIEQFQLLIYNHKIIFIRSILLVIVVLL